MKKVNILIILFLSSVFSSFAGEDIMIDDFETSGNAWEPVDQISFEIIANPHLDDVNSSAKVMRIIRPSNAVTWAGIILRDKAALTFGALSGQYRYIHMKILKTTNGKVSFKLEKDGNAGSFTDSQNYSPSGEWQEIVFDMAKAGGVEYDDYFIMPDESVNSQSITVYIDDIVVKPDPEAINPGNTELPGTFQLVWADEFDAPDGSGLNSEKWTYETGNGSNGWGNQELEYYTNRTDNVFMRDGLLVIKAIKETYQGFNYTSGRFISRNKGDWKYGRIEARFKLPKGLGVWPAIWMMPTDSKYGGWPNSGEIDIMEFVGHEAEKIYGTIHRGLGSGGNGAGSNIDITGKTDEFHVIRIDWEPGYIKWYLNDQLFHTYNNAYNGNEQWPFDQEFYCILNLAVGGQWGGAQGIDETIWPQEFLVDYVRVYQKTEPTALKQIKTDKFSVSPLSKNELKITSLSQRPVSVTLYSSSGQKQLPEKVFSENSLLNISGLPKGIYIISISDGMNTHKQKIQL
jgi:beta-glucanase (GH16 family)